MLDISCFKKLLIFPTSRAIREYIKINSALNILLPKMITIGDFFKSSIYNDKLTIINNDIRILYLQKAISNININKLGLSNNFSKFYNQSEYIFKFFNEINSEFKDIEELYRADIYTFYEEHIEILNNIYNEYNSLLKNDNKIDISMLPKNYTLNKEFLTTFDEITIYYEGYFSAYEFEIINQASKYTNIFLYVTINQFNIRNIDMFKKIGIQLEVNNIYKLDISNKKIIYTNRYINRLINHKIYPIKQRILQIGFIKFAITDMIKKGLDAKDIVVVISDESFAEYLKLFDNEKYFNFAMGNNIKLSTLAKKANAIYNLLNNDEPQYKEKITFYDIDNIFIDTQIKPYWNNTISQENFNNIIDFLYKDEANQDILDSIEEIRLSLDILLFQKTIEDINVTLKDGYKILLSKINSITLDDTRAGKITVLGILETRYISYDGVIVIDFNDDKIPKRSVKDKFISTNVKQIVNLPTLKDRENLQKYYYKRLFDKAKDIYISYVDNESSGISRFTSQLFDNINIIYRDFSTIFNMKNGTKLFDKEIYLDIDLSAKQWSATSFKTYLQCKRSYYFKYILKIKEHSFDLKPQGYEIGNILHKVLEDFYREKLLSYDVLCNMIDDYKGKNIYLDLELEIWKQKFKLFIQKEKYRFENEDIDIYALEKKFQVKYNSVVLNGSIDRIDKVKDGYIILDYKTSKSLKIDTQKNYQKSIDFQLEFYYLATKDLNIQSLGYYDLNDSKIKQEICLEEKLNLLDEKLKALQTKRVNFSKCEDKQTCNYCPYKIICGET